MQQEMMNPHRVSMCSSASRLRRRAATCATGAAIFLVATNILRAQAPTIGRALSGRDAAPTSQPAANGAPGGIAPNNPWFRGGAQIGYKLDGNSDFSEDLIASARTEIDVLKFIGSDRWSVAAIGNISKLTAAFSDADSASAVAKALMTTADGINFGLYPYYTFGEAPGPNPTKASFVPVIWASTAIKWNGVKNPKDSSDLLLRQGRASAGAGVDMYIFRDQTLPLSLSIEPVYTSLINRKEYEAAFSKSRSPVKSLELTAVLPISTFGLLGQVTTARHTSPLWRLSLIYIKSSN